MSIPFPVHIPLVEHLGLRLERFADGEAELSLTLDPDVHTNSFKVAHGGLLMMMLDVAMAHAARSRNKDAPDGGPGIVTIEMKTSFMQPAKGPLVAKGRLIHRTATLAFTEGSVYDAAGRICSHATGTFKYVKRLPVDGRNINQLKSVSTD